MSWFSKKEKKIEKGEQESRDSWSEATRYIHKRQAEAEAKARRHAAAASYSIAPTVVATTTTSAVGATGFLTSPDMVMGIHTTDIASLSNILDYHGLSMSEALNLLETAARVKYRVDNETK